jgi:hypothetical protein
MEGQMTATVTPAKALPKVDARGLAWAAEKADGLRDKDLVLYTDGNRLKLDVENAVNRKTAIVKVRTNSTRQRRSRTQFEIPLEWDAVFLTESAVEKFCFPYYEAQRLLSRSRLNELKRQFYEGKDAGMYIGIVHIPPSHPRFLKFDGTTATFDVPGVADEDDRPCSQE